MPPAKYTTKVEYLMAIRELHQRARRSGWNLGTAPKAHIAGLLNVTQEILDNRNRAYGISLDDIRAGRV